MFLNGKTVGQLEIGINNLKIHKIQHIVFNSRDVEYRIFHRITLKNIKTIRWMDWWMGGWADGWIGRQVDG